MVSIHETNCVLCLVFFLTRTHEIGIVFHRKIYLVGKLLNLNSILLNILIDNMFLIEYFSKTYFSK